MLALIPVKDSTLPVPTGAVTITAQDKVTGATTTVCVTALGAGAKTPKCSLPALAAGVYRVTATYAGDASYIEVASLPRSLTR